MRLIESETEYKIDRLKEKANRARKDYLILGILMIIFSLSFAVYSLSWGPFDKPILPLSIIAVSGILFIIVTTFWGRAIKEAEKQDNPENHPVFKRDPWSSLLFLKYWKRLFRESKPVFVHTLVFVVAAITVVVALIVTVYWVYSASTNLTSF